MILRSSAISDQFKNPERLTVSENMKPFISSYTIQFHIFLINTQLSYQTLPSSIKSRDDKLRSKRRLNQLWTRSRTRSRIASLCQICQSWSRCIFCLLMFSISDNVRFSHFIKYPYQKISRLDCICFTGDGQQVWSRSSIFGECERFQRKTHWLVGNT